MRLKGLQERGADLVSGGAPAEAAAVAVEDVGRHMAKDVREVATAADAESGAEAALGLLAAWHLSRITPSVWRLRRAGGWLRRGGGAATWRTSCCATRRDGARCARGRIHTASRGAVRGVLQHTQSLSDLRALEQTGAATQRDGGAAAAGRGGGGGRTQGGAATPPRCRQPRRRRRWGEGGAALRWRQARCGSPLLLVHVHAAATAAAAPARRAPSRCARGGARRRVAARRRREQRDALRPFDYSSPRPRHARPAHAPRAQRCSRCTCPPPPPDSCSAARPPRAASPPSRSPTPRRRSTSRRRRPSRRDLPWRRRRRAPACRGC